MIGVTYELNGTWVDLEVEAETTPAEPDVNWPGGISIVAIYLDGNNITGKVNDDDYNNIIEATDNALRLEENLAGEW